MSQRPNVVAFDAIETIFSLEPLRERFAAVGLPREMLDLWFAQLLRDAFALAASDSYAPFREIAKGALLPLLSERGLSTADKQVDGVLSGFAELPAHADADAAMRALRGAGIRMIAVTNGSAAVTQTLLARSNLTHWIELVVSVDEIRRWKPRAEVYLHAARRAEVEPARLALVATHAWDVHGAKSAGLVGAYVARGKPFPSAMAAPDIAGDSLLEVSTKLTTM